MSHHRKHKMPRQIILITLALTAVALLAAIVGTRAWLYYRRELATMTKIQFSELYLTGTDTDPSSVPDSITVPVDLGEINITENDHKDMPFRIHTNPGMKYILQIGHTTNLPLTYEIWTTVSNDAEGNPIKEKFITGKTLKPQTYSTEDNVQKNAEPVYWQSDPIDCGNEGYDDYVLIVSWSDVTGVIDKDTEMIYLTAGIGGYETNETTQPTS